MQFSCSEECIPDSITKFSCGLNIKSIQEDVFLVSWVGSFMSWCNLFRQFWNFQLSFIIFVPEVWLSYLLKLHQDLAQGFSQMFQTHIETDLVNDVEQQNFYKSYKIFLQSSFPNWRILVSTECLLTLMEEDFYNKNKSIHV